MWGSSDPGVEAGRGAGRGRGAISRRSAGLVALWIASLSPAAEVGSRSRPGAAGAELPARLVAGDRVVYRIDRLLRSSAGAPRAGGSPRSVQGARSRVEIQLDVGTLEAPGRRRLTVRYRALEVERIGRAPFSFDSRRPPPAGASPGSDYLRELLARPIEAVVSPDASRVELRGFPGLAGAASSPVSGGPSTPPRPRRLDATLFAALSVAGESVLRAQLRLCLGAGLHGRRLLEGERYELRAEAPRGDSVRERPSGALPRAVGWSFPLRYDGLARERGEHRFSLLRAGVASPAGARAPEVVTGQARFRLDDGLLASLRHRSRRAGAGPRGATAWERRSELTVLRGTRREADGGAGAEGAPAEGGAGRAAGAADQ